MALFVRIGFVFITCFAVSTYLLVPSSDLKDEVSSLKQRVLSIFPENSDELHAKLQGLTENICLSIEKLQSIPEASKDFSNTIEPLIAMGNELVENLSALNDLQNFKEDKALSMTFYEEVQNLQKVFQEKAGGLLYSVMSLLREDKLSSLDNYQRYYLTQLIGNLCRDDVPLPAAQKNYLLKVKQYLEAEQQDPFIHMYGSIPSKVSRPSELKIFTLNTCFMPGGLSLLYGGVKNWQGRIDDVVTKVSNLEADVLCFQEVHDEKAAMHLYEKLKNQYAHFYFNMGPKVIGLRIDDIGLNSGLFVASKYSIKDPYFEAFSVEGKQEKVNKGFFYFTVEAAGDNIAHIVTCHLEPFNGATAPSIRERELFEMLEYAKENQKDTAPVMICGDFNIPWGKYEPGQYLIEEYFYDPFNENRKDVEVTSRTCTDFFNKTVALPASEQYAIAGGSCEILDYMILLKKEGKAPCVMHTELVSFFDVNHPDKALSDHNGLLGTLQLNQR